MRRYRCTAGWLTSSCNRQHQKINHSNSELTKKKSNITTQNSISTIFTSHLIYDYRASQSSSAPKKNRKPPFFQRTQLPPALRAHDHRPTDDPTMIKIYPTRALSGKKRRECAVSRRSLSRYAAQLDGPHPRLLVSVSEPAPGPRLPARRLADPIPALSRNGFTHFRVGSTTRDEDGRSRCAVFFVSSLNRL